jgi:predicted dienelactone hydrolase
VFPLFGEAKIVDKNTIKYKDIVLYQLFNCFIKEAIKKLKCYIIILYLLIPLPACASDFTAITLTRRDGASVPVRLFGNWQQNICPPTVLLSHGYGGNEKGLSFIAEGLVKHGYRIMTMGHKESGGGRNLLRLLISHDKGSLVADEQKHVARFMDLEAALAYATQSCTPPFLALGGHSMGAATTMIEAGANAMKAENIAVEAGKDRFDAYVALSPQGVGYLYEKGAWNNVKKPVLMVTGTKDGTAEGADYTARFTAFEGLPTGKKRFAIIDGASHLNLGGLYSSSTRKQVVTLITEFLEDIRVRGMLKPVQHQGINITDK